MTSITEKQLSSISLKPKDNKVSIFFTNVETVPLSESKNEDPTEEESEDATRPHEYKVTGYNEPHQDLVNSMKKLRKHAFELIGIEVDSKQLSKWHVTSLKIQGDVLLHNSRAIITLGKETATGKIVKVGPIPQVTMYPEKDDDQRYHKAEELSAIIEDIIEEAWSYLNGKYADSESSQLALFPTQSKLETNFTK